MKLEKIIGHPIYNLRPGSRIGSEHKHTDLAGAVEFEKEKRKGRQQHGEDAEHKSSEDTTDSEARKTSSEGGSINVVA